MKKLVLLLFLSFGLTSFSVADYLDDWPDDPLCAWMENPSTPSYISDEVKKRDLTCLGGIVIYPPDPNPPDPNPPGVKDQPIRPGWKIAEGSNFWTIDESDPYWETEEGIQKVNIRNQQAVGVLNQQVMSQQKQQAADYAQENPTAPPPIASYYATDPCGEGKQPPNASC